MAYYSDKWRIGKTDDGWAWVLISPTSLRQNTRHLAICTWGETFQDAMRRLKWLQRKDKFYKSAVSQKLSGKKLKCRIPAK